MQTIAIKGEFIRKEVVATATAKPGHLVDVLGGFLAALGGRKAFALENDLVGEGVDDVYAVGDTMQVGVFPPGAEVYAELETGANVAAGAALESNGSGQLQALSTGIIIGYALEAVDATAGAKRIKIEVA